MDINYSPIMFLENEMTLDEVLSKYKKPLLAFSGGSDSTYLLVKMKEICNDFVAVTLVMPNSPTRDLENICNIEKILDVKIVKIDFNPISIKEFRENPKDRCYFCKACVFETLKKIGEEKGCDVLFDGTNADDLNVYRPGMKAKEEAGVISPLSLCGINKKIVFEELKNQGLPYKPSDSCYATRVEYNEEITLDKLNLIRFCEDFILKLGISSVRCRLSSRNITVDVPKEEQSIIFGNRDKIVEAFRDKGVKTLSLDLEGFISGKQDR